MFRRVLMSLLVAVTGVAAAACADESPATAPSLEITGAWARTSPMMASVGAAYLEITSPVDDRLTAARVDPAVAAMVEIHEMVMAGGAMSMKEMADGLVIPAGQTVSLKPGGYHLMLMDLATPLEAGSQFDMVLVFETAGEVTVSVDVRDEG